MILRLRTAVFALTVIVSSQLSAVENLSNACRPDEYQNNLSLLKDQEQFAQKQMASLQLQMQNISTNFQVVSSGAGLQKAFLGLSSYAFTTALFLEGFGVKTAGGLVEQGRLAQIVTANAATKWQAFRKVMLFSEEAAIYPIAPNLFSGFNSPKNIGEGIGEFVLGGNRPEQNTYDIESLPLTGFINEAQWEQFQSTLTEDLRTFYKIHRDIFEEREQYNEIIKGITFKYSLTKQKEFFQKLYDETSAHRQIFKFQNNYLKIVEKKLRAFCSNQTFIDTTPLYTPLVLKEIPAFTEADYLRNVSRYPAPMKKALNRFERYSLLKAKKDAERFKDASWLPEKAKIFLMILGDMMTPIVEPIRQARLDRIVNQLRPFVYDDGMRACYKPYLMGSEIENAINIGCDIYVTSSLMDKLNDLQLLAVLAHELSHGDQGHLVDNVKYEGTALKKHIEHYFSDTADEMSSGVTKQYLAGIRGSGHLDNFLTTYSELAPKVETQADQGAVFILNRAGIDRKHLIDALIILHNIDPKKVDMNHPETYGPSESKNGVRNYPGLFTRIRSINAVILPKKNN